MNDTHVTIVGNVVDEPKFRTTESGIPIATFRIASSSRRFDKQENRWVDNARLFANVTCWRAMAQNVHESLHKGQPVIAVGRLYCREYKIEETARISYQLDADAVGPDLSRGTATFSRVARPYASTTVEVSEDGMPADVSSLVYRLAEDGLDPEREDDAELVPAG